MLRHTVNLRCTVYSIITLINVFKSVPGICHIH